MRDEEVSKLISVYLNNTGSDDKELELKELRQAIDKLTSAFTSSTQTHEQQNITRCSNLSYCHSFAGE